MLEKFIQTKNKKVIVWTLGAIIEVIGLGLLFAFDKTMSYIHQFPMIFSILLIAGGFFLAVSER